VKTFQKTTVLIISILISGPAWSGDKIHSEKPTLNIELKPEAVDLSKLIFTMGKSSLDGLADADAYLLLGAVNVPTNSGEPWADLSNVRPVAYFNGRTVNQVQLNGTNLNQTNGQWPRQYLVSPTLVDRNLGFGTVGTWYVVDGKDTFTAQVAIPPALEPSVSCGSSYSLSSGQGFDLEWENSLGGDVGVYAHFFPEVARIGSQSQAVFAKITADSGVLTITAEDLQDIGRSGWLNILIGRASYDTFSYGNRTGVAGATAEETITVRLEL